MKKILFTLIFMCAFAMCAFAGNDGSVVTEIKNDATSAVSTVYNDSKDLIKAAYPEIKEAVVAIASGIGVAAEHVYTVLIKKYVVDGISELVLFLLGAFLVLYAFFKINNISVGFHDMNFKHVLMFIYEIIGVIVLCNVNYDTMLMGLINPEFGVINYIIEYSKTMIN